MIKLNDFDDRPGVEIIRDPNIIIQEWKKSLLLQYNSKKVVP